MAPWDVRRTSHQPRQHTRPASSSQSALALRGGAPTTRKAREEGRGGGGGWVNGEYGSLFLWWQAFRLQLLCGGPPFLDNEKNQRQANFFLRSNETALLKKAIFFRGGARDRRQRGAALAHGPPVGQLRQAPRPVHYGTNIKTRRHRTAPFSPSNRPRVIRGCLCFDREFGHKTEQHKTSANPNDDQTLRVPQLYWGAQLR